MSWPAQILLKEDYRMDIEFTLNAFEKTKLTDNIHIAENGEQALNYLFGEGKFSDRKSYPLPDLVFLDLKLPAINGYEVFKIVKSTLILISRLLVFHTTSKKKSDLKIHYDNNANSYLVKPIFFEGFFNLIRQINNFWLTLKMKLPIHQGQNMNIQIVHSY